MTSVKYDSLLTRRDEIILAVVNHKELTYKQLASKLEINLYSLYSLVEREGLKEFFNSHTSAFNDGRSRRFIKTKQLCGKGSDVCGEYKGLAYRSQLELSFIMVMQSMGHTIQSAEELEYAVEYTKPNGRKGLYFPDFYDIDTGRMYEIKPKHQVNLATNQLKFAAAKEKYGSKFKIMTDEEIYDLLGMVNTVNSKIGSVK